MPITTKKLAEQLDTDPRSARRFLRSIIKDHERGDTWEIPEHDLEHLKLLFNVRQVGLLRAIELLEDERHNR